MICSMYGKVGMARFEVAVCFWAGIVRPCTDGRSHSYLEASACCCFENRKIAISEGRSTLLRLSIFGLGYVGTVCAACLAQDGHQIIGVDPVPTKVDLINAGKSTIIEAEIGELIAKAVRRRDAPRYRQDCWTPSRIQIYPLFASVRRARSTAILIWLMFDMCASRSAGH